VTATAFRHFVFDCDSTLSRIEGIEALARRELEAIRAMTRDAMEGRLPLEEVYGRRLALVAPTREEVLAVGRRYVEEIVEDAAAVVAALRSLGKDVQIVSGGVLPAVLVLAEHLGLPAQAVHAVDLRFDSLGRFAGFDANSPLARRGGKRAVLAETLAEPGRAVFVGDGVTDLETLDLVGLFVGFGGVVVRPEVARRSPVFVRTPSLAPVLALALTSSEQDALLADPTFAPLLRRARALAAGPDVIRNAN
jgi:phosphoserine phosphatase